MSYLSKYITIQKSESVFVMKLLKILTLSIQVYLTNLTIRIPKLDVTLLIGDINIALDMSFGR